MFLSKHKNGFYYIYFTSPEGRRNKVSAKTKFKNEAIKFLSQFEDELKRRYLSKLNSISLSSFTTSYLKSSEVKHRPKTTKSIKTILNSLKEFTGDIELSSITSKMINDFLQYKASISLYTSQKYLAHLRCAFNLAIEDKYISENPCKLIKNFKLPERQPLFFSEVDFEILLQNIDNQDFKDLSIFAVNTGLRQSELISLEWNQINFKDKSLILDNRNHITKSKKIRTIPLNIKAMQVLIDREKNKSGLRVFTYEGKPIKQFYLIKKFKKYIEVSKLNPELTFHSLRHSFASWLVQKGVSIYTVSKLLGHSDIKVSEIYSHLRSEDLMSSVNMLNN